MDSRLKQRLVGAAVLVALAVIFLPMLVQGPAPDSGVSNVPLSMPDTPRVSEETRELPLVAPGQAPDGGAVGMPAAPAAATSSALPVAATTTAAVEATTPPAAVATNAPTAPAPTAAPPSAALPATTAAGDYAVAFGSFSTTTAADKVVAALRASQLPAYREASTANGKPAWRVRIGPYATRAAAESARLRATHVRDDLGAQVVTLDAAGDVAAPASAPVATVKPATPAATAATPTKVPAPAPATPAAATHTTGFALQLAAFSKPEDANALRDKLRGAGFSAFTETVSTDKGALTRVRVGPVLTRTDATLIKDEVKAKLGLDGVVRPHP